MQYFDFNLPYLEDPSTGKTTPAERAARKKSRLKLAVKAVELGYSGIAYNRSIKGVISESDRCSISHFPLSSLLSLSPSLSSSAAFHRRLLSGTHAAGSPFRQYTRLTVSVDNPSQSSAFNSGNAILKTYDLVAVRPMNQVAFDQACQFSEVDLIAIDFSDKIPFRLKIPMVKAAIARGVYFEITYSGLIEDIHVRRKLIANAKPLVDWTRGKNLIVSSASASVLEFRGPNDVANLLSLLGLASEHAKAAISKNCRSLIAKTLKKKQFYKEAIKVDMMPSAMKSDPKKPWVVDSMEWDPISSGEGDLLLEDLAKSFSEAGKGSETSKPNDVVSIGNNIASHCNKATSLGADIMEFDDANNSIVVANGLKTSSKTEKLRVCSQRKPISLFSIPQDHNSDAFNTSLEPFLESMNTITSSIASESQLKGSEVLDIASAPVVTQDVQNSVFSQNSSISNADSILQKCEAGIEKQTHNLVRRVRSFARTMAKLSPLIALMVALTFMVSLVTADFFDDHFPPKYDFDRFKPKYDYSPPSYDYSPPTYYSPSSYDYSPPTYYSPPSYDYSPPTYYSPPSYDYLPPSYDYSPPTYYSPPSYYYPSPNYKKK